MEWVKKKDVKLAIEHNSWVKGTQTGVRYEVRHAINNLETKTIDEGFSVGDEVWVISDIADLFDREELIVRKTKIEKRINAYVLSLPIGDISTRQEKHIYRTKELAEQALIKGDL